MLERVRSVVPDFEYVVDDLSSADDASIARRTTSPFMRLVLWSLRARGEVAVKNRWRWMEALQQLWRAGRTDEVHAVVRYNVRATNSRKPWVLAAARDADPELERSIMNIWDERIAEGEARGRVAAKAETLLKQIRLKFGAPNEDTVRRVEAAEVDALDRWVERILTADSLDALFAED